ncbi:uncharacterized protein LOC143209273 [Lasioglossum baleicum]|uniref:uncharacterized protein LOC143209273 n=1 Tax=Lasioglossum baleicum TaxID=434251 RepID=UPI003FCC4DF5
MTSDTFRSRGMKMLKGIGMAHVYEILDTDTTSPWSVSEDQLSTTNYVYPMLGRTKDVELFKDILDDIGVSEKSYSGMLIEGAERSGKSRLLDAFATVAQNRQLTVLKLTLSELYAEKEFSVLYQLLLQLFGGSYCTTIQERERITSNALIGLILPSQYCYLNPMMKVQFPLSQDYCSYSDWERHTKTIEIFKTILKKMEKNICILLDDVHNMDVLSWKFLAAAMENDNVIIAMTVVEPQSWDNMSQVQQAICQDKRLMNRSLQELEPQYITAFACQFLNVLAIPKILDRTLQKRGKNSIAWCEAFLTSTLQIGALEFVNFTPMDHRVHELVFPESALVAKIPVNMTPEEVAPPLNWTQMSTVNVCVPSWQHRGTVEINRDVTGLRIDIYNRMNSYEQDFMKCVTTLGSVFSRSKVAAVMINAAPLYTSVAEMIRLRILECAMIQRRHFHIDESMSFLYKRRKTFSNMHHVITCHCQPTRMFAPKSLPQYAHCQYLEFTIPAYRKLFYSILLGHEKKDFHTKIANLLEREAHRCNTCGGGKFLEIFSKEDVPQEPPETLNEETPAASILSIQRRRTQSRLMDRGETKRNVLMLTNGVSDTERKSRDNTRRISILPSLHDNVENEDEVVAKSSEKQATGGSKKLDIPWENRLKHLNYLDHRNCRCVDVVDYLYSRMLFHIENSVDVEKLTKFMLDYSAGLIATAQPIFATKFLSDTTARIGLTKAKEQLHVDIMDEEDNKEITLLLIGDAYIAYGNYGQAKRFYMEAVNLRNGTLAASKSVCLDVIRRKLQQKFRSLPKYILYRVSGQAAVINLTLAMRLQRLATVMMLEQETKLSKSIIVQSFDAAFRVLGGFLEKGRIYLTAVTIFRCDHGYLRYLEKPMMQATEEKISWNSLAEVIMLADVYRVFFENRFVDGALNECVKLGINLMKICSQFCYNKVKIAVLPCLIEAMVWTKNLKGAIDLLMELYYLSEEDVDKSALTWYYALCLEMLLDAGMFIESYEACHTYYSTIASKLFVNVCRTFELETLIISRVREPRSKNIRIRQHL